MKIRILKCPDNHWYADKVGQVLDVEVREHLICATQGIPGDVYWCREGGTYNALNYVLCSDAEVVDEDAIPPEHEYPTRLELVIKDNHKLRAELLTARLDAEAWRDCADKLAQAMRHEDDGMLPWEGSTESLALAHYDRLKAKSP